MEVTSKEKIAIEEYLKRYRTPNAAPVVFDNVNSTAGTPLIFDLMNCELIKSKPTSLCKGKCFLFFGDYSCYEIPEKDYARLLERKEALTYDFWEQNRKVKL